MKSAVDQLRRLGMAARHAADKGPLFTKSERALDALGSVKRRWSIWVPGRIEVLGKHTDYAGGRSLLCALERGFCVRTAARRDGTITAVDAVSGSRFDTTLGGAGGEKAAGWASYVLAVARRLAHNFPDLRRGADIAFASDLPQAAGLASSSALLTAVFIALSKANDLRSRADFRAVVSSAEELAGYLGAVESGEAWQSLDGDSGVGTLGGSEDHTAMLCCETGVVTRYAFGPVRREGTVAVPEGLVFALGVSGVAAEKAGGARDAYNRAALVMRRLLAAWNRDTGQNRAFLADVLRSAADAPDQLRAAAGRLREEAFTPQYAMHRLDQFMEESFQIVPSASDALARGALEELGLLVDRSQRLAEDRLGNQVPQTVALQRYARQFGAVAASAFGAGFGGSVWALVPEPTAKAFLAQWESRYREAFPAFAERCLFFLSGAGPHALQW